jgi:hypothetical protein
MCDGTMGANNRTLTVTYMNQDEILQVRMGTNDVFIHLGPYHDTGPERSALRDTDLAKYFHRVVNKGGVIQLDQWAEFVQTVTLPIPNCRERPLILTNLAQRAHFKF